MSEGNATMQAGLEVRRAVVGADYVDRSMAEATDFSRPLQHLASEYCWGTIWTRPGLSRRDRSLVNVGMLTALNRPTELRLHVQGAVRNGCSSTEISEVLLQAAVYCGLPAAVDAFKVAEAAIDELQDSGR